MKSIIVGPYVMSMVNKYNNEYDVIVQDLIAQHLMSRKDYRMCLEANYPELYKELKETDFLNLKRD